MIRRVIPIIFLFLIFSASLSSQSKAKNRMNFHEAESWILFEDYREALPLYQELIGTYPDNSNIRYRIGQCYLNLPGEKEKAISFLEEAVENINPAYRENNFREKGAPYDALYYLANAYRIDNQLDKAIETYKLFMEKLDPEIYDTVIVSLQIQSCLNAKVLMASPVFIKEVNLGNTINDNNSEYNPVVSADETMMVFSRSLPFYDALLYSVKMDGSWTGPLNMNEILRIDRDIYPVSLSGDGKVLYLYNSENYDGNIYTTTYNNGSWSPAIRLNDNINTKYWESHAVISPDNKKLFFTSNRKGTYGGLDIYVSGRDTTGDWGPAVNLGPVINTRYNEETPFLSRDGKTLFFSSRGHMTMGGHDVFYSTLLDNGQWSVPLNAGYPLNSTDDDLFFMPLNQGYEGYFSKLSPDGFGKQDIYRLEIFSDNHPRKFMVRGIAKVAGLNIKTKDKIRVSSFNSKDPADTAEDYANPETGEYELLLNHGDHTVIYEINGKEIFRKDIHLPLASKSDSFILPPTILPKTDDVAVLQAGEERNLVSSGKDTLVIPLIVESNSVLTAEHLKGDSLLYTEQFNITDTLFRYKILPSKDESRLLLTLKDQFGNTSSEEFFISQAERIQRGRIIRPEHPEILAEKRAEAITRLEKQAGTDSTAATVQNPADQVITTAPEQKEKKGCRYWYLWLIAGTGLIFLFVILKRKKDKNGEKD